MNYIFLALAFVMVGLAIFAAIELSNTLERGQKIKDLQEKITDETLSGAP